MIIVIYNYSKRTRTRNSEIGIDGRDNELCTVLLFNRLRFAKAGRKV